jgi:hypothetical protein
MLKRYRFWLWLAVVFLLLNALIHSLTFFFFQTPAQNETERQLLELMSSYKQDFGAGFKRSTKDLFTALSACFSLICLLGGLTIAFLLRKQAELRIIKGVVCIHVLVFGICFAIMAVFTFLPPIVLTGLIFLSLLLGYFLIPRQQETIL